MRIKANVFRLLQRLSLGAVILMIVMIFLAGGLGFSYLDPQSATAVGQVPARLGVRGHGALMLFSGALRHGLIVWLLLLCVGAFDEWHQISIPGRQASAYDLLADALGVALGIWVAGRVRQLIRVEA